MTEREVKTPEDALVYLTDCTIATVAYMAMMKNRRADEYKRQKSIAQQGVDWIVKMGLLAQDYDHTGLQTRVQLVVKAGSVDAWAKQYEI